MITSTPSTLTYKSPDDRTLPTFLSLPNSMIPQPSVLIATIFITRHLKQGMVGRMASVEPEGVCRAEDPGGACCRHMDARSGLVQQVSWAWALVPCILISLVMDSCLTAKEGKESSFPWPFLTNTHFSFLIFSNQFLLQLLFWFYFIFI